MSPPFTGLLKKQKNFFVFDNMFNLYVSHNTEERICPFYCNFKIQILHVYSIAALNKMTVSKY